MSGRPESVVGAFVRSFGSDTVARNNSTTVVMCQRMDGTGGSPELTFERYCVAKHRL